MNNIAVATKSTTRRWIGVKLFDKCDADFE
jgi:hypothetical protein